MNRQAVIYEVRLSVDAAIEASFDEWLGAHIAAMLQFDGFETAETFYPEAPDATHALRIVRYRVANRDRLENYLTHHADTMRAEGARRFGDRFTATRAIYPASTETTVATQHRCQNCETPLQGQYCAVCGQRDKHRIISLLSLGRELVGDMFEVDSRVWRTLWPLLFKPGELTSAYLRGRRVRYTPPLRLYLVTSLLFFLVAFFGTGDSLVNVDLSSVVLDDDDSVTLPFTNTDNNPSASTDPASEPAVPDGVADENAPNITGTLAERCEDISFGDDKWSTALTQRATRACHRLTGEGGLQRFVASLVDNLPGMMFVFLPVIALAMSFLYLFSRRYYVEHLLFLVHYHSFFFVTITIAVLVSRLPASLPGQHAMSEILNVAAMVYIPVYLFVAMRRIYQQRFGVTLFKYLLLGLAYFSSLLFTLLMVILFTALSV